MLTQFPCELISFHDYYFFLQISFILRSTLPTRIIRSVQEKFSQTSTNAEKFRIFFSKVTRGALESSDFHPFQCIVHHISFICISACHVSRSTPIYRVIVNTFIHATNSATSFLTCPTFYFYFTYSI